MKKLLLAFIFGIFLISFASAYLTHTQNTSLNLVVTSNNATSCNLSTVTYPDGSTLILNQIMSKNGQAFNITLNNNNYSQLGTTCHYIVCTDGVQLEAGSSCWDITGNGKDNPDGIVIVLFSLCFLIIMGFLIYELIVGIGHFASLDLDIVDVAKSIGIYFALIALYELGQFYLGNPDFSNWIVIFMKVGAFTNVIVPLVGFTISITVGSLKKKTLDFGMQRTYRRNKYAKI